MKAAFNVLIADDDSFSRQTAVRMMRRLGAASVTEAVNGHEALRFAEAQSGTLDLIICDLRMPQMDGIETLRALAALDVTAAIILASGADPRVLRAARDMAFKLGIKMLWTVGKPLTLHRLQEILAEIQAEPPATNEATAPRQDSLTITAADIRRGMAASEFKAFFQPKVAMRSQVVVGAEALIRWQHPVHGTLSPASFLSVAFAANLFDVITDLMLTEAAAACARWRASGLDLSVSVNVPVVCISQALPQHLDDIVAAQGLDPEHVVLELVEDGLLESHEIGQEVLTRLRLRGFGLSIDDFGTGFSTLQQLLQAPFSEMKIDRTFVQSAPTDPESAEALLSSITLAHSLGMHVVGEGVETETQWRFLQDADCDVAQGYLLAPPLVESSFIAWIHAWNARQAPTHFSHASKGRAA